MNKNLLKIAFATAIALTGTTTASAQDVDVTYGPYDGSQNITYYGTGKKETYDVAIHITDASLVGKTVKGIIIPFSTDTSAISNRGAIFLTKELKITNKKNVPDIEVDSFDVAPGNLTISFAQPYTITSDGVYVGYTVGTKAKSTSVIPAIASSNPNRENFYMHTTTTYRKWASRAATLGGELAFQVIIGGAEADKAVPVASGDLNTQINTPTDYTFSVVNKGTSAINSVDYSYSVAGQSGTAHYDFTTPITAHIGASANITFALQEFADGGTFPITITLDKVNGKEVADASTTATIYVYKTLPTKRALLEEYTRTWCGYCPRGFVGLEHMNELLGNDFVGVSYHNGDPMEFTSSFPSSISGYPDAWIDRAHETDAYCGDNYDGHFNIDKDYAERNTLFAPADLNTQAYFTDDSKAYIDAKTSVTFPVDNADNKYQLSFILTADGLSEAGDAYKQSSWDQSNYYSGSSSYPDDDMKQFTSGDSYVKGLTYNFVVCGWSGSSYISGSLPSSITGDEPVTYTYTFDLSKSVNTGGNPIIQDKSKLHVVTLLIDTSNGQVVNALKSNVYDSQQSAADGIKGVSDTDDNVGNVSRQYFTIDGKQLAQPQKGLNIVRMSNGKVFKTFKK